MKLANKVAVITGASKGLGLAIAQAFSNEGCRLLLTGRSPNDLSAAARTMPGEVLTIAGDVADESHVAAVFDQAERHFGGLDLVVNNAGAFDGGPLDTLSTEAWDHVINTNLRGPFLFTRAAMKMMKPKRSGRIINIGSISAQRVRVNSAAYSASKHALWGLTQSTALEGREFGVTCCCIHPGNIAVERRNTDKQEDGEPMMSPADVAEVVLLAATLPSQMMMLETIVLPSGQDYVGRG